MKCKFCGKESFNYNYCDKCYRKIMGQKGYYKKGFLKNRRGIMDIFIWMIIALITLVILGAFLFFTNQIHDKFAEMTTGSINMSDISAPVTDPWQQGSNVYLKVLATVIIIGMAINIFISNFMIKGHPIYFFVYMLITIVAIIVSAYISNVYIDTILQVDTVGATFQSFTAGNYIMQWLPYWVAVIGIFGAIFLFIGIIRDNGGTGV